MTHSNCHDCYVSLHTLCKILLHCASFSSGCAIPTGMHLPCTDAVVIHEMLQPIIFLVKMASDEFTENQ
jgi:hypothetical protein